MRKGLNRIILGTSLVILQVLSLLGSSIENITYHFESLQNLLAFTIGYILPGVCGIISLALGIRAYMSGETIELILHNRGKATKIFNYVLGSLMLLIMLLGAITAFESIQSITGVLYIYATLSMIVYLWFHQGKKPSSLYAASIIIIGCIFVLTPLINSRDIYALLIYAEKPESTYILRSIAFTIACGVTNIVTGILLYRETFSVPLVKILGFVSFVLFFIPEIETILDGSIYIDFYSIRYLLHLTILIHTCFIPIHTNKE